MDTSSNEIPTENEMRQFAERMVTSFVNLSEQSRQLVELKAHFQSLEVRVNSLVEGNARLMAQVETLVSERDKARAEATENLQLAQTYANERDTAKADNKLLQDKYDRLLSSKESRDEDYRVLYEKYREVVSQRAAAQSDLATTRNSLDNVTKALDASIAESKERGDRLAKIEAVFSKVATAQEVAGVKSDITSLKVEPMPVEAPQPVEDTMAGQGWWNKPASRAEY